MISSIRAVSVTRVVPVVLYLFRKVLIPPEAYLKLRLRKFENWLKAYPGRMRLAEFEEDAKLQLDDHLETVRQAYRLYLKSDGYTYISFPGVRFIFQRPEAEINELTVHCVLWKIRATQLGWSII